MAESAGEKTEMPTPKKLRDAREKGQVCTSKDIVSTAILIVLFAVLGWMGMALMDDMESLLRFLSGAISENSEGAVLQAGQLTSFYILKHSFVFVAVAAVIGIVGNVAQIGFLFTFEPLIPKLEKLNPVEGAKKIFSMKNLFEFLKNVVKVSFLSYLLYKIIWASVPELLTMCYGTVDDIFPSLMLMLKRLAIYTAFGYIVIAIVDRIFQGRNFTKQMMMTKDEVKREYKEMEGSQEVKQAQREFRNEILNGPEPAKAAKESSVVVTNPTHLAVGIRFKAEESPLPRVCALGAGKVARIIRETALAEGIPIIEDRPLARALYANGKIGDFIPDSLIEPVAEVLKWAKQIQDARKEEEELDSVKLEDL
ncbi:MAG: EscU/YscU/HrcU family type III secretion system export apparatus switch protein [Lentisphaerae bacterium]|nr:EscU/YscU/HrcU family type III secretion system export apparatus switch protein [Lentisphaerota bacterium]